MENKDGVQDVVTKTEDSLLSFGAYLKKIRLEKGISIEEVMDFTRISKYILLQIEEDNLPKLPEPVYLKGFLKSFAQAIGVEPDEVMRRYNRTMAKEAHAGESTRNNHVIRNYKYVRSEESSKSSKPGSTIKWIIGLIAVLAVSAGVFFAFLPEKTVENQTVTVETPPVSKPVEVPPPPPPAAEPVAPAPADPTAMERSESTVSEGLHLEVVCIEATGIKISVDGGAPDEYNLKPEDHLDLTAKKLFNILVDNKCGVTLFLNNNPVPLPGKCGQSVNIQLP